MPSILRQILYGIGVWALPFVIAFGVFPIAPPTTDLFESIIAVAVALAATLFAVLEFRSNASPSLAQGFIVGTIWLVIAVVIDLPFFIYGVLARMTWPEYIADIGLTYVMIPIIAAGIGHAAGKR